MKTTKPSHIASTPSRPSTPKSAKTSAPAKPNKSRASHAKSSTKATSTTQPDAPLGKLVRQHDINGFVVINLPAQMRQILGEEAYQDCVTAVQRMVGLLTVREEDKVLFVRMAFHVADADADGVYIVTPSAAEAQTTHASAPQTSLKPQAKPASRKATGTPTTRR